ncbi:hypothetical protein BKA62DRAFT_720314 [Auriculariales sp. MPI-PUGE-AT-0066]|nr:hypothetical protein BKA62DRAFT_720314 [Auriculariales sp. MPI-PUGE-AT-0066]
MPGQFADLPDELLLRILTFVPPLDLSDRAAYTSKRVLRIAQDEEIWLYACRQLLEFYSDEPGARFNRELWCPTDSGLTMFEFWRYFLKYYAQQLGWWLAPPSEQHDDKRSRRRTRNSNDAEIFGMLANLNTGMLHFSQLKDLLEQLGLPNNTDLSEDATYDVLSEPEEFEFKMQLFEPEHELAPLEIVRFSPQLRRPVTFTDGNPSSSGGGTSGPDAPQRPRVIFQQVKLAQDAPALQLIPAFDVEYDRSSASYIVPTISDGMGGMLWQLVAQAATDERDTDALLRCGWYAGIHPTDGTIIIFIRTVDTPSSDGQKRVIAVQMTGKSSGKVLFVVVISHRDSYERPVPGISTSGRTQGAPWSVDETARTIRLADGWDEPDAFAYGGDCQKFAGLGRALDPNQDDYDDVLINVACETEVQVAWLDGNVCVTFKRLLV